MESGRHPLLSLVDMLLRRQFFPDSTRRSISSRLFHSSELKMQSDGMENIFAISNVEHLCFIGNMRRHVQLFPI